MTKLYVSALTACGLIGLAVSLPLTGQMTGAQLIAHLTGQADIDTGATCIVDETAVPRMRCAAPVNAQERRAQVSIQASASCAEHPGRRVPRLRAVFCSVACWMVRVLHVARYVLLAASCTIAGMVRVLHVARYVLLAASCTIAGSIAASSWLPCKTASYDHPSRRSIGNVSHKLAGAVRRCLLQARQRMPSECRRLIAPCSIRTFFHLSAGHVLRVRVP
jgi:hypothetical protein